MKKNLNSIKFFAPFIIILLFAKALSVGMIFFLPKASLEKDSSKNSSLKFRNFELSNSFWLEKISDKIVQIKAPTYNLQDLMLQAIYKDSQGGVIIVVDIKSKKTIVLALLESYKSYKLVEIYPKYVIFLKNEKKYTLKLYKDTNLYEDKTVQERQKEEKIGAITVSRKEIQQYTTDFKTIWKNIGIQEKKQDGKIVGFKINYIKTNSIFDRLGLKKGDVITKINAESLVSYAQAFKIYNNIQTFDYLTITVSRDGKERDFDYEIK